MRSVESPCRPVPTKVVVYAGDLTAPRFGLTEQTWDSLAAKVGLIIHSGSRRSFWDNYWELRRANLLSTKELAGLAVPRRISIHSLSSSGVLKLDDKIDGVVEASVADFQPPTDGSEGYGASKWASEVFLEKANRETVFLLSFTGSLPVPTQAELRSSSSQWRSLPSLLNDWESSLLEAPATVGSM